jgi:membrane-associated phospholipid phosphatase
LYTRRSSRIAALTAFTVLAALLLRAPAAGAQTKPAAPTARRLDWQWHRFGVVDYALTAVLTASYLTVEFAVPPPTEPKWRGHILFDESVRDAMVAESRTGRDRAAIVSDILTLAPQLIVAVDTVLVPLVFDNGNFDVALQMALIDIQAIASIGLLSRGGHRFVARERPDVSPCTSDREYHGLCLGGRYASFPSGHTASAFGGAGLVCAHHARLPLYGGGAPDVVVCVAAVGMAGTASMLRVTSDRHYISDVIVGTALGVGLGFVVPYFVHYRKPSATNTRQTDAGWMLQPTVNEHTLALGLTGWF